MFQYVISLKQEHIFNKGIIKIVHFVLMVTSAVTFVIFFTTGLIANSEFQGKLNKMIKFTLKLINLKGDDLTKWKREDGAFGLHLVSTVNEWICANSVMLFIYLLKWELEKITVNGIRVTLNKTYYN